MNKPFIEPVFTPKAPNAIGPYSQAVKSHGLVYCSGQIPLHPETGELVMGSIVDQTRRVLDNLKAVLEASGANLKSVLKTTIFLTDLNHFHDVNTVYAEYFSVPFPARTTIEIKALPRGAGIEIEAIAQDVLS
jgi:2-iminobutanoate/2-iminopropanoate deaminase